MCGIVEKIGHSRDDPFAVQVAVYLLDKYQGIADLQPAGSWKGVLEDKGDSLYY